MSKVRLQRHKAILQGSVKKSTGITQAAYVWQWRQHRGSTGCRQPESSLRGCHSLTSIDMTHAFQALSHIAHLHHACHRRPLHALLRMLKIQYAAVCTWQSARAMTVFHVRCSKATAAPSTKTLPPLLRHCVLKDTREPERL